MSEMAKRVMYYPGEVFDGVFSARRLGLSEGSRRTSSEFDDAAVPARLPRRAIGSGVVGTTSKHAAR